MMRIDVRTNVNEFLADMGNMRLKQAPFAVRQAINATAAAAADVTRTSIRKSFRTSPRGLKYLLDHVKVLGPNSRLGRTHLPSGGDHSYRAYLAILPPEGKGQLAGWDRYRGSLLPMLEEGGATPGPRPFGGNPAFGRYAVPVMGDQRPRWPMALFPINLGLQSRRGIAGPLTVGGLRGKQRTFLLPILNSPGNAIILQRRGKHKKSVRALFWTQQHTRLPARRYFFPTVVPFVQQNLPVHLRRAMDHALFSRGTYKVTRLHYSQPAR
jgi:hypothetical protein